MTPKHLLSPFSFCFGGGEAWSPGRPPGRLGLNLAGKPVLKFAQGRAGGRAGEGLLSSLCPSAPGLRHPPVVAGERRTRRCSSRRWERWSRRPPPAQVGGSGHRLLSRPGADFGWGAPLPEAASCAGPGKAAGGEGVRRAPGHLVTSLPETQAASEMLENGERPRGPDPSFGRMLSSSSSMSNLNSSTVRG